VDLPLNIFIQPAGWCGVAISFEVEAASSKVNHPEYFSDEECQEKRYVSMIRSTNSYVDGF